MMQMMKKQFKGIIGICVDVISLLRESTNCIIV